jgi:1-deoxy-D-xylulose-5-phosphate reductoisomerase
MATNEAVERLTRSGVDATAIGGTGREGLMAVATHPEADVVLCASSGTDALEAVLAAVDAGKTIALANKEVLVMAGGIVMETARRRGVPILPVDSEHNAIHQCVHGRSVGEIRRVVLTASGGPFRGRSASDLLEVTASDALKHPTWRMGRKITIDSSTLMNKGFEMIEAHHLFAVPYERIDVVVHPQSIVHSIVHLNDGASLAHLGYPDMKVPISYALHRPERADVDVPTLDLASVGELTFESPDADTFACLRLAREAGEVGGTAPCVLNAADEVAVEAFLAGRIPFTGIPEVIDRTLEAIPGRPVRSFDDLFDADATAREHARGLVEGLAVA